MSTPEIEGFQAVRDRTEWLAAPLSAEDQVVQSMTEASPTKWHRAHTTWFFEEFVLTRWAAPYEPVDPRFRYLFNSYYEAVGPRHPRPQRGLITRPSVTEVGGYRREVDARMAELLSVAATDPDLRSLVELGCQHEQQHQELLLMDAKHLLSQNPFHPAYGQASASASVTAPRGPSRWVSHEGGLVDVGHGGGGFCFDNETPRHPVFLRPFVLADHLVTAGEWLAFMGDDGYRRAEFWLSDGWAHINAEGWRAPEYWQVVDGAWHEFTLAGLQPVDETAPVVHVSYYEADAYARWAGARLPLESEWEAVVAQHPAPDTTFGLQPTPSPSADGLSQAFGAVWQWTASPYTPYPGFRTAPGAVGEYNGKFMVDQQVLRGSACITPPGHQRVTYRNFFPARSRWAFSGVRLARDA